MSEPRIIPDGIDLELLITFMRVFIARMRGMNPSEVNSDDVLPITELEALVSAVQNDNGITLPVSYDPPLRPTIASIARVAIGEIRRRPSNPGS